MPAPRKRARNLAAVPDYQGISIGNVLSEWLSRYPASWGIWFASVTSPAMIGHGSNSSTWPMKRFGHRKAHGHRAHRRLGMLADTGGTSRLTILSQVDLSSCSSLSA